MLARHTDWNDWPRFAVSDFGYHGTPFADLRREFDRLFGEAERDPSVGERLNGPALLVEDKGSAFTVRADVPGLTEKELDLTVTGNTVTLRAQRQLTPPADHSAHRRERGSFSFAKSFELPARIDAQKVEASLKHGVLTLTLPKAADAQPRQIAVKAS